MLNIKKNISVLVVLFISFYSFADNYTHNDLVDLIRESGDLEKLEKIINYDESLVINNLEVESDCILALLNSKSSNFKTDTDFYKYAESVINLLPTAYWLTKNCEGNYPIFIILAKCNPETELKLINLAIEKTSNLNIENEKHQTPLSYIATYFDRSGINLLRNLLDKGADINYKNSVGYTAIMYAAEYNTNEEIFIELYCSPNVKLNIKNGNGESISILASKNSNPAILQYLINQNGYENNCDFNKKTPLMHACELGFIDNVKILVKQTENINQQDNFGKTALMYAMENNKSKEIYKFLLKNGADKKVQDKKGFTSIDYKEANAYLSRSKTKNWKVIIVVIIVIVIMILSFIISFILKLYSAKEYRVHFDRRRE